MVLIQGISTLIILTAMNINERFLQTVKRRALTANNNRIIVAFSGGADSVVMLHLLLKNKRILDLDIIGIAHLDHGLRGQDSYSDRLFCEKVANENNIEYFLEIAEHTRDEDGNPPGSEAWGRNLRRSFFNKLHKEHNALIATGHNAGDVAETVLLRMIRGTSSAGMHGIKAKNGFYIRPIIDCSREEIRAFADEKSLAYCVDFTNEENDYNRNIIRNRVFPILYDINPSFERSINRAAASIDLTYDLVKSMADEYIHKFPEIELNSYSSLHKAVQLEVAAIYVKPYREPSYDLVQKARLVMLKRLLSLELKKGVVLQRKNGKAVIIQDSST